MQIVNDNNKDLYLIIQEQKQLIDDFTIVCGLLANDLNEANLKIKKLEEKNNG